MNLRRFKKEIEYYIGDFVDECIMHTMSDRKKDNEKIEEIIDEAVELYDSIRSKSNAKTEGNKRAYFTDLRREMEEKINVLSRELDKVAAGNEE